MDYLTQIADKLAMDTLNAADAAGDETIVDEVNKSVYSASPTVQEAFMTAVRFRRAERRARITLGQQLVKAGLSPEKYGCSSDAVAAAEKAPPKQTAKAAPEPAAEAPVEKPADKPSEEPAQAQTAAPKPAPTAPKPQPMGQAPKPSPAAQPQPKSAPAAQAAPKPAAEPEEPARIMPRTAPRSPFRKVGLEGDE
ncbi:MAG: hypothetical protein HUJ27_13210 [Rhodobacteraceae bacterium]|nr:hypothetical protein [Paracoccaceae bacterium]